MTSTTLEANLSLLRKSEDETETRKLCETILNFDKENTQLMIALEDGKEVEDLFLKIWKQIGKVSVLPLLSAIRYKTEDLKGDELNELLKKQPFILPTFWKDLLALGTNLENLKSVVEIMYNFSDLRIIPLLKELLQKVKMYWEHKELMSGIIRLIDELNFLVRNTETECEMIDISVLSTISVLLSLLFTKDPSTMDLHTRNIVFPGNAERDSRSLPTLWLEVIDDTSDSRFENKQDLQPLVNVVRQTLPIMINVLDQLSKDYQLAKELFSDGSFDVLLRSLDSLIESSDRKNGIVVVIESGIMVKLLEVVSNCANETPISSLEKYGFALDVIDTFMEMLTDTTLTVLSSKNRIAILPQLADLINSEWIYKHDESFYHDAFISCICSVIKIAKLEEKSEECVNALCNPEHNILSAIIEYAKSKNYPEKLEDAAMCIHTIVQFFDNEPKLVEYVIVLLPLCLENAVNKKEIDRKDMDSEQKNRIYQVWKPERCNAMIVATLGIYTFIATNATIDQLKELQARFKILETLFKAVRISKMSEIIYLVLGIVLDIVETHHFDFLSSEDLAKQMPLIWKKMKISIPGLEGAVATLTYWLALNLPSINHPLDFTDWEPSVIKHAKSIVLIKPQPPGLFRLIWEMAKLGRPKQLFRELHKLASDKTVGYAAPGRTDLAKIFKLISEIIVEYLENDPPYNTGYLTDLTQCMVEIARSSTLDEELYVLEDMVSPAIWLLEKQSDEKIVANVKEFLSILH